MEMKYSKEFKDRKADKLKYRFPRGESYLDVIHRLEPLIFEIERAKDPVIVISHTCVIRCLYAYFSKHIIKEVPFLRVPANTVIKLEPEAYFCYEHRYEFDLNTGEVRNFENPQPLFVERTIKRVSSSIILKE